MSHLNSATCRPFPVASCCSPMTVILSPEVAKSLMLTAVGDEAYIEVTTVNPDGSVVVMQEAEDEEAPESGPPVMPEALTKILGA